MLLSFQNLGQSSVTRLRNELGRRDRGTLKRLKKMRDAFSDNEAASEGTDAEASMEEELLIL